MVSGLVTQPTAARTNVANLNVRRSDIRFGNVAPGRVRICVRVANEGDVRSESVIMSVQAAPFGAFARWKDLTSLVVGPIEPYDSVEVSTEVTVPKTSVLGDFSRIPPRRLLAAMAGDDEPRSRGERANTSSSALWSLLGRTRQRQRASELPHDPFDLLGRPNPHWAGNINVLIGNNPVERHLAQALRVYPGRTNLAAFIVGDRPDQYQFALSGSGCAWEAALFDLTDFNTVAMGQVGAREIPGLEWVHLSGCRMLFLAVAPPPDCERGWIEIHVRQRSTNREAVVEFSLDAQAAGAGCYSV